MAAPQGDNGGGGGGGGDDANAKTIRDDRSFEKDGKFSYSYEVDNGVKAEASGENKEIGDAAGMTMSGSYSFVAPDGNTYTVTWVADENGYQPTITGGAAE